MEEMNERMAKINHAMGLLGYSIEPCYGIYDKNHNLVAGIDFESPYTLLPNINDLEYFDFTDGIYKYIFNENQTIVVMKLLGPQKEIILSSKCLGMIKTYKLSWKAEKNDYGFMIETGQLRGVLQSLDDYFNLDKSELYNRSSYVTFSGHPEKCACNGGEIIMELEEFVEENPLPVILLSSFDITISKFINKSLSEIIEEKDLKQSGLNILFDRIKDAKEFQKKMGKYGKNN